MAYQQQQPTRRLRPFIDGYWMVKTTGTGENRPRILPDGCQDIIINTNDPGSVRLVGTMTSHAAALCSEPVLFGVRFKPAGLAVFAPVPQSELRDQVLTLESVCRPLATAFTQIAVPGSHSFAEWVAVIEPLLLRSLIKATLPDRRVLVAVESILTTNGQVSIRQLTNDVCVSERQLERLFAQSVGIAPKPLSEIVRFRALCHLLIEQPNLSLTDAAFSMGYYDSAHLTRVFKRLSGELPSRF